MRNIAFVVLLCWCGVTGAETAYVQDQVHANLRSGKSDTSPRIKVLPPAAPVEIQTVENGYAHVRTQEGIEGWLSVKLLKRPKATQRVEPALEHTRRELKTVQEQLLKAQGELERERETSKAQRSTLWLSAGGCLLMGLVLGMLIRERHYRRRLNGLQL
ncbi:MAG: SH3 domain-containing protein [Burkholderiales bacterium]